MAALLGLLIVLTALIYMARLRYRLEYVTNWICWYKWLFWLCEWVMLPLMFNIAWLGNCTYYTQRPALTLANCK